MTVGIVIDCSYDQYNAIASTDNKAYILEAIYS